MTPLGLAGVVAPLSLISDLARGHPPGEAARACLVATELARRVGLADRDCRDVYYATLLRFAGCTATSHEVAGALGGDDIAVRARGDLLDLADPAAPAALLAGLAGGTGLLDRIGGIPAMGRMYTEGMRADCEVGAGLARRLRLPDAVERAVREGFERYDGRGAPAGLSGEDIALSARLAAVGFAAVMFDAVGGVPAATDAVRRWSGHAVDPAIAAVFLEAPAELLTLADPDDLWAVVAQAEPFAPRTFRDLADLDEALAGYADAADLKSPWLHGHSRGVAALAAAAAPRMGLDPIRLRRAGLVHDLGRVAVPTGIWERPGPLRPQDWESVRLHGYHSGRIAAHSPVLAPLAPIAGRHHERVDGSGYPTGVRGSDLDAETCLLAAADAFHALGEARPHRPAMTAASAARVMAGLPLDRDAVRAVLDAADAPAMTLSRLPAGLTDRELDVLRLLVTGRSKRQIAEELVISYSTVHTHTVHIYDKCAVTTRAGLAMFAMRHDLVRR